MPIHELFTEDNCDYSKKERDFLNYEWSRVVENYNWEGEKYNEEAKKYSNFICQVYPNIWFRNIFATKETA